MFARLFATNKKPYIPGWNNRRRLEFDLSGVKFSIEVPHSNAPDAGAHCANSRINIFDPDSYPPDAPDIPDYKRSPFRYLPLFNENWDISGSIFSSAIGGFTLSAAVVRVEDLPEGLVCNSAQDFFQVADREMYFRHGPPNVDSYMPRVPINWSVTGFNNSDWLYYEAWPDVDRYSDLLADWVKNSFNFVYLKPITEQHFICISSRFGGGAPESNIANYVRRVVKVILESSSVSGASSQVPLDIAVKARELVFWKEHVTSRSSVPGARERKIETYGTAAPIYKI